MLDIERDSMVDAIAVVRLEERVANPQDQRRVEAQNGNQASPLPPAGS